jgi:dynein heavy chain
MANFLKGTSNGEQTEENAENTITEPEESTPTCTSPVLLEKFENQIRKFETIHKSIMGIDPENIFCGWLRVDVKPLKQVKYIHWMKMQPS